MGMPLSLWRIGAIFAVIGGITSGRYIFEKDIEEWAIINGYASPDGKRIIKKNDTVSLELNNKSSIIQFLFLFHHQARFY